MQKIFGRIVDQGGRPIVARMELWFPHLDGAAAANDKAFSKDSGYRRNLLRSAYSDEKGWYLIEAPEGEWLLRVSKGPEYELKETILSVAEKESDGRRIDWAIAHLYDLEALGWRSGDMHHHSSYSDGRQTLSELLQAMIGNGLGFGALTDHNQVAGSEEWVERREYAGEKFLPIPGIELSTSLHPSLAKSGKGFGHMNAIGVAELVGATDPENPNIYARYPFESAKEVQKAIDETHELGGLFLMAHPMWAIDWPGGNISTWGEIEGFDAIDVFIGWDLGPHMPTIMAGDYGASIFATAQFNLNTMATQVWFEFLNAGNKIAAWASSDSHDVNVLAETGSDAPVFWYNTSGHARIYVQSEDLSWPSIKEALKAGRGFVTSGYYGPLLLVDIAGALPGETLRPRADGTVLLHYRLLSNRPLKAYPDGIRVIVDGRVALSLPTSDGAMSMEGSVSVRVDPDKDSWLVVEAFGDWPSMAMTNAFYLHPAPSGGWGSAEWRIPPGAEFWNNPFDPVKNVPAITVPDGPPVSPNALDPVKLGTFRKI